MYQQRELNDDEAEKQHNDRKDEVLMPTSLLPLQSLSGTPYSDPSAPKDFPTRWEINEPRHWPSKRKHKHHGLGASV